MRRVKSRECIGGKGELMQDKQRKGQVREYRGAGLEVREKNTNGEVERKKKAEEG